MAVKSTGLTLAGARSEFFNAYDAAKVFPWERFCMKIRSNKASENYRWLGTVPQMREWGAGRLAKGLRSESYDVVNQKYEATIEVDRDEISDDQTGQINIRIKELAKRAKSHPGSLLAQLLIYGATSGFNSYDGVTFFNDTHVSGASGNQDNDLTATAAAAAKTTAECKAALQASITALLGYKDDQGEPVNEDMSGVAVIVPPSMYFPMLEAAEAPIVAQTSNVLADKPIEVLQFPRLTLGTTYYTCKLGGNIAPFAFQDREALEFDALENDSETGFLREKFLYGVRARYAMTYAYWQFCVRTVFNN